MNIFNLTFEQIHDMSNDDLQLAIKECDKHYDALECEFRIIEHKMEEVTALVSYLEVVARKYDGSVF